jgi:hypothetical protein
VIALVALMPISQVITEKSYLKSACSSDRANSCHEDDVKIGWLDGWMDGSIQEGHINLARERGEGDSRGRSFRSLSKLGQTIMSYFQPQTGINMH